MPEESVSTMAERSSPSPVDPPDPAEAETRRRRRGFLNHLIGYFAVMVVLVPLNAVVDPGRAWFVLPLVGWGAPLALHAAYAMGLIGRRPGAGA